MSSELVTRSQALLRALHDKKIQVNQLFPAIHLILTRITSDAPVNKDDFWKSIEKSLEEMAFQDIGCLYQDAAIISLVGEVKKEAVKVEETSKDLERIKMAQVLLAMFQLSSIANQVSVATKAAEKSLAERWKSDFRDALRNLKRQLAPSSHGKTAGTFDMSVFVKKKKKKMGTDEEDLVSDTARMEISSREEAPFILEW